MKHRFKIKVLLSAFVALPAAFVFSSLPLNAYSQNEPAAINPDAEASAPSGMSAVPGEMDAVEQLFVNEGKSDEVISDGPKKPQTVQTKSGEVEMKGVSDLANLAEFKDIAVIQKRFLPKTGRFEGFGGLNGVLNDKFFITLGINARLAYFFNERWAIEGLGMAFATGEKSATKGLKDRGVITTNFVSPTSFYGADVRWTPVYGKMSFINRKITPFDLYFSAGLGMTNTKSGDTTGSSPTFHLGTGQVFAITKSAAFRWDFSWNFYSATSTATNGPSASSTYNNLFLTVGASFFFPEATYR